MIMVYILLLDNYKFMIICYGKLIIDYGINFKILNLFKKINFDYL